MKISIVTINYKTPVKTVECIQSIFEEYKNECENQEIEHIIVDNNSNDDSLDVIKNIVKTQKYTHVKVIESHENLGFGKGCNLGSEYSKGELLIFLNSDTVVKNRGFLDMYNFLKEHQEIAIIGGKLKNTDGTSQLSASKFYTLPILFLMLLGLERFGFFKNSPKVISKVDWVSGACMMVKKNIFEKIGKFDSHIFMYMEDMEFCFRASRLGYETYFFPEIEIIHSSYGSSNRSFAIINIYKGIFYFYRTHMSGFEYSIAWFILRLKAVILVIIGKVIGNSYLSETYEKTLTFS